MSIVPSTNIEKRVLTNQWWIEQFDHLYLCKHLEEIDINYLRLILFECREKLNGKVDQLEQGLIHNDFQPSNTLCTDDNRHIYVIDFGEACYAPLIVDLATALFLLLTNGIEDDKRLNTFLLSYQNLIQLDRNEIELLDTVVRLKLTINFIGENIKIGGDNARVFVQNDNDDFELRSNDTYDEAVALLQRSSSEERRNSITSINDGLDGLRGPCELRTLKYFDVYQSFLSDTLHTLYEGVMKQQAKPVIHALNHFADSIRNYGPAFRYSTFEFEATIGSLAPDVKKFVTKYTGGQSYNLYKTVFVEQQRFTSDRIDIFRRTHDGCLMYNRKNIPAIGFLETIISFDNGNEPVLVIRPVSLLATADTMSINHRIYKCTNVLYGTYHGTTLEVTSLDCIIQKLAFRRGINVKFPPIPNSMFFFSVSQSKWKYLALINS
ncbi:unnamed protein product [Rotaria sp. Silwood1]|nr:unnamed protein product [Rotaria sp. Silwood1]